VSHSVHLKPRPPTRGLSLRAARHTTGRPVLDDCLRSTSSVLRCRQKLLLRCVGTEGDGIRGVGSAAAEASHCLHE
jgi:hypothetical protein